jgi:hypothetical protein
MSTNLSTTIAGTTLPLRATEIMKGTGVKGADGKEIKVGTGKFWHTLRKADGPTMMGVRLPALDTALPTSIEIDGHEVDLDIEMQEATQTDFRTKKVTVRKVRHLQAKAKGTFESTTLNEPRAYSVTITDIGDGLWNVTVKVNRVGGSGSVSPESKQASAAATLAEFLAS